MFCCASRSLRVAARGALFVEQGEVEQVLWPACRTLVSPELRLAEEVQAEPATVPRTRPFQAVANETPSM